MAFDAAMLSVILHEIRQRGLGGKIEKVYQPEQDEIQLAIRGAGETCRLQINAGANNPRLGFTSVQKENPLVAPMFCMLLRKHLSGARLTGVEQPGFERVAIFTFDTREIRAAVAPIPLNRMEISAWIQECLQSEINELHGGNFT